MAEQTNSEILEKEEETKVEPQVPPTPVEEVNIPVPAKVDASDRGTWGKLKELISEYSDDPDPIEIEEVYEGEDPSTYKTGSLQDYGTQSVGGVIDTVQNMSEMAYVPEIYEAANSVLDVFRVDSDTPVIGEDSDILGGYDNLILNFKGFENYDPERPAISFMSDEEFSELRSQDKISYRPYVKPSKSAGATLTRNLTRVVAGLIPANKVLKGAKWASKGWSSTASVATKAPSSRVVKGLQKYGEFTSVGTLGSVFSFKPYEPRIADDMAGFVQDTPFQVTQPFFEWMSSADSDSEVEERFKIALESMIIDATLVGVAIPAFSTFFKVFRRERKLAKAEASGAPVEDLQAINDIEVASINSGDIADIVHPPSQLPKKVEARKTIAELRANADNAEDFVPVGEGATLVDDITSKTVIEGVSISTEGLTKAVKSVARAVVTGDEVGSSAAMQINNRQPLINLKTIENTGVKNVINALSNEIDREAQLLGKVVTDSTGTQVKNVAQKEIKTFKDTKKQATPYANYIRNRSEFDKINFEGLATTMKVTEKELFKLMEPDRIAANQIGSRVLAWQMVLDDMTTQFHKSLDGKDLADEFVQLQATEHLRTISNLWNAFTELPRGLARGLSARRIMMDKKYLKKTPTGRYVPKADLELNPAEVLARNTFLKRQLKEKGMNKELLEGLARAMGAESSNILKGRALRDGLEASFRGRKAFLEMFRGLLLTNNKTLVTNLLGNTMETLTIPLSRTIGHMATFNVKGVKEEMGFMVNMVLSSGKATRSAIDSLIHERNLLDPLRTKAEAFDTDMASGFYMQMEKATDAGYWHPQNWIPLMVNTVGKVGRASLRVLGSQDEFFKTLTYNAKAMSKIAESMPENLSRADKKKFIRKHIDMFYDDAGEAVDRDLLEYSRRSVFQEDLEKGRIRSLHEFVGKYPEAGIFLPFIRTPANLVSRAIQRTPVANFMSERTKRMWNSGSEAERAEVIGNTILGVGILGTAIGYSMSGMITGSGPTDPARLKLWKAAGFQPYSLKVGDRWYRYDRLEPLMLPFIYVSSLHENLYRFNNYQEDLLDSLDVFVQVTARTLTDRTWLRGLKNAMDALDTARTSEDQKILDGLGRFATNFIPAGINQAHRLSGLADEDSGAYAYREAITFQERVMAKLPPSSGYDAIKYNWLTGEPMLLPSGSDFGLDNTDKKPNKYMRELLRFQVGIQGISKKVNGVELSAKQYSRLSELTGTHRIEGLTLMEQIEEIMDLPEYDLNENSIYTKGFPSGKEKQIVSIINAYKESARWELLREDKTLKKEVDKMNEKKDNAFLGIEQ